MGHPFVPTLLVVWALSMVLRSCGVTSATLPLERPEVRSAAPVTEAEPVPAPRARG